MVTIIILAGAPEYDHPGGDGMSLLQYDGWLESFRLLFRLPCQACQEIHPPDDADLTIKSTIPPAWRSIPLERQHLATGLSQIRGWQLEHQSATFFNSAELTSFSQSRSQIRVGETQSSSNESAGEVLSQFYEQSYAIHEDTHSSIVSPSSASYHSSGEDMTPLDSDLITQQVTQPNGIVRKIPLLASLTNLGNTPTASFLRSVEPQTVTTNFIVGVIFISPVKTISMKRGGTVDLVELLVGDETKSGFTMNLWLPTSGTTGLLRATLGGLRPQDIILMQNVALSSFKGKVYGQSLRRDMTKLYLVYRRRIDKREAGGVYRDGDLDGNTGINVQQEKTKRVRDWVLRFVGAGMPPGARNATMRDRWLPNTPQTEY